MNVLRRKKGFTLIELIVVITIIGILAAVMIPSITGYIDKANGSAAIQEAESFKTLYQTWLVERDDIVDNDLNDDNNPKNDFFDYVNSLNYLGANQKIETLDNKTDYESGFKFTASNNKVVLVQYDLDTGNITLTLE